MVLQSARGVGLQGCSRPGCDGLIEKYSTRGTELGYAVLVWAMRERYEEECRLRGIPMH